MHLVVWLAVAIGSPIHPVVDRVETFIPEAFDPVSLNGRFDFAGQLRIRISSRELSPQRIIVELEPDRAGTAPSHAVTPLPGHHILVVADRPATKPGRELDRSPDEDATDIVRRVVALGGIPHHILDA